MSAGFWLLHGTREPWTADVVRDGLIRHSQAAFVVPADTNPADQRLRRTLLVAMSHAVGLTGWEQAHFGETWTVPSLVVIKQPAGWRPPAEMPSYRVHPSGRVGPLGTEPGPTHSYVRIRDVGPLCSAGQRRTAISIGRHELACLIGDCRGAELAGWFDRLGAKPRTQCPASRWVCESLARQLIGPLGTLFGDEENPLEYNSDSRPGGRRRLRQPVGQGLTPVRS